ncbi:MAG: NUDIX hydrolase [Bacteroidota bacterium]
MSKTKNPWKTLSVEKVYDNPWIKVEEHQVLNPSGNNGIYGKVHFKNLAIAVIPLDEDFNTWIVGQYRYTLDEYSWEVPMGGGKMADTILSSAQRELKEETGLTASKWQNFLKIHTSNSVTDEVGYAFVAEGLTEGETEFEDTEDLKIQKLPFRQVYEMVLNGEITDCLSVASILKLAILKQIV